jgi:hypothetical protein
MTHNAFADATVGNTYGNIVSDVGNATCDVTANHIALDKYSDVASIYMDNADPMVVGTTGIIDAVMDEPASAWSTAILESAVHSTFVDGTAGGIAADDTTLDVENKIAANDTAYGTAVNDAAANDAHANDATANDAAAFNGVAANGAAANGTTANSTAANGAAANGAAENGAAANGTTANGTTTNCAAANADITNDAASIAAANSTAANDIADDTTYGTAANGSNPTALDSTAYCGMACTVTNDAVSDDAATHDTANLMDCAASGRAAVDSTTDKVEIGGNLGGESNLYSDDDGDSDGEDASDRDRVYTQQRRAYRHGNKRFKHGVRSECTHVCAITGCTVTAYLDIAHITPHHQTWNNEISDGVPLKVDFHRVFDNNTTPESPKPPLLSIYPCKHTKKYWIVLSKELREDPSGCFKGLLGKALWDFNPALAQEMWTKEERKNNFWRHYRNFKKYHGDEPLRMFPPNKQTKKKIIKQKTTTKKKKKKTGNLLP